MEEAKKIENEMSTKLDEIQSTLRYIERYFAGISAKLEAVKRIEEDLNNLKQKYPDTETEYESECGNGNDEEEKEFRAWIIKNYGDCASVRAKIEKVGAGFFMEWTAPASHRVFYDFVDMEEGECFCKQETCQYYKSDSDDE